MVQEVAVPVSCKLGRAMCAGEGGGSFSVVRYKEVGVCACLLSAEACTLRRYFSVVCYGECGGCACQPPAGTSTAFR
jgi:hypothetical protein